MRKTSSRVPMLLIAILLGSLITWTPTVSASGNSSAVEQLQAQSISAIFDGGTESTTVYWSNLVTTDYPLMLQMQESRYLVYRHNAPLNESVAANLVPWANVSMCPSTDVGTCSGRTFQLTYPLPAGTNGTYYYAIVSYFANNDDEDGSNDYSYTLNNQTYSPVSVGNFVHGEANVSEGIVELTNDITAPFFVQANFIPTIGASNEGATDISWVNLNTIVPDSLPEVGDAAYEIRIYRHGEPATRETWSTIDKTEIAQLNAGDTTFRYMLEANTDEDVYYSVTYLYLGYEDVRFLGTNTLANSIHEDNVAPGSVQDVSASFAEEPEGGTGNTTITWTDIESEEGETYHIWRSGTPINDTTAEGVELVGIAGDEDESYRHQVERGMLGLAFYAVTASDTNGNHNNSVSANSALEIGIEEDTFSPWIAEPTNVQAVYIGNGQTTITWTDQLGVEGEQYHVWRSCVQLTSMAFIGLEEGQYPTCTQLVATVPDSVETVTVSVPDNIDEKAYYSVSSLARYSLSSEPYEDLRFQFNWDGPIDEDTLRPSLAFLQDAYMTNQGGNKITLLRWVNDLTESGETYQIWMNENDPFGGNEEIMSGDISTEDGWIPIGDPVYAEFNNQPDFTRVIDLADNLDKTTWYAVTMTDQYGNENTQYSMSMNAREVIEDTTPPEVTLLVENEDGEIVDSLREGDYRLYVYANEELGEYPILNLRTSDYAEDENGFVIAGTAFTEQSSTVRAQPLQGSVENAYRYQFEITNEIDTADIRATLEIRDAAQNVAVIDVTGWAIDSQSPTLEVYAPSQESLYLYGEQIHVYGAVSDYVGIASVEIQFRYYDNGIMKETDWTAMTDLTSASTSNNSWVFEWWEPAATFHDLGNNQKVTIRVTDTSGNEKEWFTLFTVDNCLRIIGNYDSACIGQQVFEPEEEVEAAEESYYEGVYLMVYVLGGINVVLLIMTMLSVLLNSPDRKKKRGGEEDDEDDWMREFMGGGGDEAAAGSPDDVRNDMASLSEDATERADAEDPFAKSEGRDRKRRKKTAKAEEVEEEIEEEVDEDDEFDDEDDDWDDDSGPKKKTARKSVKRRSVRRK